MIEDLLPLVDKLDTDEWLKQIADWRKQYPLKYPKQGGLKAQHVLDRLDELGGRDCIITTDVGQHQMWAAQFCLTTQEPALAVVGRRRDDGLRLPGRHRRAVRQPGQEGLGHRRRRRLPDDDVRARDGGAAQAAGEDPDHQQHYLGMVRQWQELFFDNRLSGVDLEGNPDFVKLADAYGIKGWRDQARRATSIAC